VDVSFNVTDGSATVSDNDYSASPTSGTLHWDDGDATDKNIVVTVNGDDKYETDETVNLSLSGPTGAVLGTPNTATLTIKNDDNAPTLSINGPIGRGRGSLREQAAGQPPFGHHGGDQLERVAPPDGAERCGVSQRVPRARRTPTVRLASRALSAHAGLAAISTR